MIVKIEKMKSSHRAKSSIVTNNTSLETYNTNNLLQLLSNTFVMLNHSRKYLHNLILS